MTLNYIVTNEDMHKELKHILKSKMNISSNLIIRLKNDNKIFCNSIPVFTSHIVNENDRITVNIDFDETAQNDIVATNIPLDILYEDEYLLIVNKPANMPTHPCMNHYDNTISNAVKYHYDIHNIRCLLRPVIRLDKDTSGIVVFAKNPYIQECLIKQMKSNTFKKTYISIVENFVKEDYGTINAPIARKENSIIERCISDNGEVAITHYTVVNRFKIDNLNCTYLELTLETGRTHQIRVHMAHLGNSIIGDTLYGNASEYINRQALHCSSISFIHPVSNETLIIETPIPDDIALVLTKQNTQF